MKQKMIGMGDRLLAMVLPGQAAGACVPENGQYCYCAPHNGTTYRFYVNCTGACTPRSYPCT